MNSIISLRMLRTKIGGFLFLKIMAAQMDTLQRSFEDSLSAIGYEGAVGKLPLSVRQNQRAINFLEWVVSAVRPANYLSAEEMERFDELKSSGKVLEVEALDQALTTLGGSGEEEGLEEIKREAGEMREDIAQLKAQLHTLNCVQKTLSEHYGTLAHERDDLASQTVQSQKRYQKAMEVAQNDNNKVNVALENLMSSTQEVCSFHRSKGVEPPETTPTFLHEVSQESYHKAEDQYLSELTAYSKKQFFQGIAELAQSPAGGSELGGAVVEPGQLLLQGVSAEQHGRHSTELTRLQQLHPLVEMQYVNAQISEEYALATCGRAREELAVLTQQQLTPLDHSTLRLQIKSKQERVQELRCQLYDLGQGQLPGLLQDMAALQVTTVLHGDYDLKLARQEYFTSKQDKVIGHLRSQQARHELLSMLYEVELRRHRETHRLLSTAASQLTEWSTARERRLKAIQSGSLQSVVSPRQTVDSRDAFAQRLCTLLEVEADLSVPLVMHASVERAVERLVHQLANSEALLTANHREQHTLTDKQEALTKELTRQVFGSSLDCSQKPCLSVKEYEDECKKVQSVLATLELNIKSLLKHFDGKKKILQANPLMESERKLFVYFFAEPSKLGQVMGDLARRVDALATAQLNEEANKT